MITKELTDYIKTERVKGKKDSEIKENLLREGGWSSFDIQQGLDSSNTSMGFIVKKILSRVFFFFCILFLVLIVLLFYFKDCFRITGDEGYMHKSACPFDR